MTKSIKEDVFEFLRISRLDIVAKETGVSIHTLRDIRKNLLAEKSPNPSVNTIQTLYNYFTNLSDRSEKGD